MRKKTQLSFSRLNTFEQCPRKFFLQYIEKSFPDDSNNPNFVRGNAIHGQIEAYISWKIGERHSRDWAQSKPFMREEAMNAIPLVDRLFAYFDDVLPEQKVAVNEKWEKTAWLANDVRWRAIFDALGIKTIASSIAMAALVDWKTGKVRDYSGYGGQLHLSTTILFSCYPSLQEITNAYAYVDHKHSYTLKFKREELPQLQGHFDDKWTEVDSCEEFNPKVNKYCGWCPATRAQCPYSKNL